MSIVLVDIFCLILIVLGIALLLKRPANRRGGIAGIGHVNDIPQTYILRIAGVMVIAFGFALGLMATVFHFA